ncbi:hypothetical protein OSTOST_14204 [Ostertagia ostertagi]
MSRTGVRECRTWSTQSSSHHPTRCSRWTSKTSMNCIATYLVSAVLLRFLSFLPERFMPLSSTLRLLYGEIST